MAEFFNALFSIVMLAGIFTVLIILVVNKERKDKKMENIYSAISISNLSSVNEIAQTVGLSVSETRELIEEIIKETKRNKSSYKLLKNAYIDYRKNEVILNPRARGNVLNKAVDYLLDGFTLKKEVKNEWICSHCDTVNQTNFYNCRSCGAINTEK
ncbi:hypothetical protein [Sporosarcina ureae]|uniref:hypothetical protein n=1 Tax=Sporosarcina ureae TaxID=1571 RepID=UPI0026EBB235|nr:hypothetical protein [Sporosarcina ureae]